MKARYHAIVFHPGARTIWRTGRAPAADGGLHYLVDETLPDPSEVVIEKRFRFKWTTEVWTRSYLKLLRNVVAEVHVTP